MLDKLLYPYTVFLICFVLSLALTMLGHESLFLLFWPFFSIMSFALLSFLPPFAFIAGIIFVFLLGGTLSSIVSHALIFIFGTLFYFIYERMLNGSKFFRVIGILIGIVLSITSSLTALNLLMSTNPLSSGIIFGTLNAISIALIPISIISPLIKLFRSRRSGS